MARRASERSMPVLPHVVCDEKNQAYYTVGEFLGKGGFAACYKVTNRDGAVFAAKVVCKNLIKAKSQSEKLGQEIKIHKSLCHDNIVKLMLAFEDRLNVYIILELCSRRSLMELQKRRKVLTEPETRYFIRQLTLACCYIHSRNIIHRDLKLGNLFLTDDMRLKVGDFGLATVLGDNRNDKKWLCGTPNYIAPEVLAKQVHTVKVDIWAIGCVLFVLLVGTPPFETNNLDATYRRISQNEYVIPNDVGSDATSLIKILLAHDPDQRPCAEFLMQSAFLAGYTPSRLPTSCLTTKPIFAMPNDIRKSTSKDLSCPGVTTKITDRTASPDMYLVELEQQVSRVLNVDLTVRSLFDDDIKDPASVPIYWVSKWLDYSERYGLAYQLCDGSFGASFRDHSKLIMTASKDYCQYIDGCDELFFSVDKCPELCQRKLQLLQSFEEYMTNRLARTGGNIPRDGDEISRLPVLCHWLRSTHSANFLLSNGTFQCNFLTDHSKLVICPLMGAITLIDDAQNFHTYKISTMLSHGAPKEVVDRLCYARKYIKKIYDDSLKNCR